MHELGRKLDVAIVSSKSVDFRDRIDPDYFRTEYLEQERFLVEKGAKKLSSYAEPVASAFYPAATHLYSTEGIPFIRCVDVVKYPVITRHQDERFERLPLEFINQHKQLRSVSAGDIVITKVGTPCYASFVSDYQEVALSRTVLGLTSIRSIDPVYLSVFLRSKLGFSQLMRERELTIQYQLTLDRVRRILVLCPSMQIQLRVRQCIEAHISSLADRSGVQLAQAELLEDVLRLASWRPATRTSHVVPKRRLVEARRWDSQFHDPDVDQLRQYLEQSNRLVELRGAVLKGRSVIYSDDGDVPIVRSGDVTQVASSTEFLRASSSQAISYLSRGDVLISSIGFGSIGKVEVFDLPGRYGTVSEVSVVRGSTLNPFFLSAFLKSRAGQLQINRLITGATGQLHLYPRDVEKVFVPDIPDQDQRLFEDMHRAEIAAEQRANDLFSSAVDTVDTFVLQGEAAAADILDKAGF